MKLCLRALCATSALALVAGCSTPAVQELSQAQPVGSEFNKQLAKEYAVLARFESEDMLDFLDADRFAEKGLAAAQDRPTQPDEVWMRDVPQEYVPQLNDARARLLEAYEHDVKTRYPAEAATAQAKFDCWLEQQEENYHPEHIAACRRAFAQAMRTIYSKEQARLSAKDKDVSRASDAAAGQATSSASAHDTLVYFAFDDATVKGGEAGKVDRIAAEIGKNGGDSYTVSSIGYADRAGPESYNQELSKRRAAAVRDALIERGIPAAAISTAGKGESDPIKPTADGVAQPENRRVRISIR
jgi:OOP family OmpA-OmpF porin